MIAPETANEQNQNSVFTITTVGFEKSGEIRTRLVGLFGDEQKASSKLEKDIFDLNGAGWYPYAVVEELPFGLYPDGLGKRGLGLMEPKWFQYSHGDEEQVIIGGTIYDVKDKGWHRISEVPQRVAEYLQKNHCGDELYNFHIG